VGEVAVNTTELSAKEIEEMGLFTKSPLKIAQEGFGAACVPYERQTATIEKLRSRHEAVAAEVGEATAACEAETAASITAIADGGEMIDSEPNHQRLRLAKTKEKMLAEALKQAEAALGPLDTARSEALKLLLDEELRVKARELRKVFVQLMDANLEVSKATSHACGHPILAFSWGFPETLEFWDAAFRRWSGQDGGVEAGSNVLG
jgi:hypothetical protein